MFTSQNIFIPAPSSDLGLHVFWFDRIDLIFMNIRRPDDNCEERLLTRTRIRLVTLFEMINKNVPPLLATERQALFRSLELIAREH